MKAIACTGYGPPEVLVLREMEKPIPKRKQVLIRVHATAVTASDCIVRGATATGRNAVMMRLVLGINKPRNPIIGMVLAGEVEAVGDSVTRFNVGDCVYAFTGVRLGAYAEYITLSEKGVIAIMPHNMTYTEAAAVPYGAVLALPFLKRAKVQPGQTVLVYGASGAIGTTAVQVAKHHYGAAVTGVCSARNLDLVRSLGADHVIDYTDPNAVDQLEKYDVVFDAVGRAKTSPLKERAEESLTSNGRALSVDDGSPQATVESLDLLRGLIEAGNYRAIIDRTYPLEDIVEAHRYVDGGHKKGNVIVTVIG